MKDALATVTDKLLILYCIPGPNGVQGHLDVVGWQLVSPITLDCDIQTAYSEPVKFSIQSQSSVGRFAFQLMLNKTGRQEIFGHCAAVGVKLRINPLEV